LFGADGCLPVFLRATLENRQSEFLQLLTFVVLTTYLVYKNSAESRDGQDEIKQAVDRIEEQLKELQGEMHGGHRARGATHARPGHAG
jgi:hypothetical protein